MIMMSATLRCPRDAISRPVPPPLTPRRIARFLVPFATTDENDCVGDINCHQTQALTSCFEHLVVCCRSRINTSL